MRLDALGAARAAGGVIARGIEVVDGTRADDDEQSRIAAIEDGADGGASAKDRILSLLRQRQVRV